MGYSFPETTRREILAPRKMLNPDDRLQVSGYRYYSPELGRWVSRDPIAELGGDNLYAILMNQPTIDVDYLGLLGKLVEVCRVGQMQESQTYTPLDRLWHKCVCSHDACGLCDGRDCGWMFTNLELVWSLSKTTIKFRDEVYKVDSELLGWWLNLLPLQPGLLPVTCHEFPGRAPVVTGPHDISYEDTGALEATYEIDLSEKLSTCSCGTEGTSDYFDRLNLSLPNRTVTGAWEYE